MNALSLFNGMSGAYMALKDLGMPVSQYFVSETDKFCNIAAKALYPNTIFLGDVCGISYKNGILITENCSYSTKIDLIVFGFPCQDFSTMGNRLNFEGQRGKLFFEALRIYRSILEENPDLIFLAENVKMDKYIKEAISIELGYRPVQICSSLVSGQSRGRLYWTNIQPGYPDFFNIITPNITQPKDRNIRLLDILDVDACEKHYLKESAVFAVLNRLKWVLRQQN